jgi:hypothetical protein
MDNKCTAEVSSNCQLNKDTTKNLITPQNPTNNVGRGPNLKDFQVSCENEQTNLRLAEQIDNRIKVLAGFD